MAVFKDLEGNIRQIQISPNSFGRLRQKAENAVPAFAGQLERKLTREPLYPTDSEGFHSED
jgi:hypothetical protein